MSKDERGYPISDWYRVHNQGAFEHSDADPCPTMPRFSPIAPLSSLVVGTNKGEMAMNLENGGRVIAIILDTQRLVKVLTDDPGGDGVEIEMTPDEARAHGEELIKLANQIQPKDSVDAVNIIFDDPPGPESGRFIEVENDEGKGIGVGEWKERKDGLWALRIEMPQSECDCIMCRQLESIMNSPQGKEDGGGTDWTPVNYTGQRKCDNCDREYKESEHYDRFIKMSDSKDRPLCPSCAWWTIESKKVEDDYIFTAKSNDGTNRTLQTVDYGRTWSPVSESFKLSDLPGEVFDELQDRVGTEAEKEFAERFIVRYVELCECDTDGAAKIFLKYIEPIGRQMMIGTSSEDTADWIAGIENDLNFED
jgi:hypothetical protein